MELTLADRRYIELHSLQRSMPTRTWTLHAASAGWPIEIVRAAYISDGRKCQFHLPLAVLLGPQPTDRCATATFFL